MVKWVCASNTSLNIIRGERSNAEHSPLRIIRSPIRILYKSSHHATGSHIGPCFSSDLSTDLCASYGRRLALLLSDCQMLLTYPNKIRDS